MCKIIIILFYKNKYTLIITLKCKKCNMKFFVKHLFFVEKQVKIW